MRKYINLTFTSRALMIKVSAVFQALVYRNDVNEKNSFLFLSKYIL